MTIYLGIDIGGSNTKFVVLAAKPAKAFKVLEKLSVATPHNKKLLVHFLSQQITILEAKHKHGFSKIGIAIAGILNASGSTILHAPNIPELDSFSLPKELSKVLDRRYIMNNDANAFVFAEALVGAAKGAGRVAGLTLGTGMGGGLVVGGRLETGAHGAAGEIGHTVIAPGGTRCTCSGRGHFENYISKRALARHGFATQEEMAALARSGNKKAKAAFDDMAAHLGYAFANIVNFWDPDVIVVGGGIAEKGDVLLSKAAQLAKRDIISPDARKALNVKKAKLGEYAGAIGAALLANRS